MNSVTLHSDGSCKSNRGGWSALLQCGGSFSMLSGHDPSTTNNRMELVGALSGMEALTAPCKVQLISDSKYLVDGIHRLSTWKRNGWKTAQGGQVANQDLWERLDAQLHVHRVHPEWVKGHATCPENEIADWFAQEAASHPVGGTNI